MTVPHHKVWAKCGHASDTKVIMVRDTGACIRGPVLFDVKYHVPQYSIRDARRGSSLTRWVRAFVWERRRRCGQSTTTVPSAISGSNWLRGRQGTVRSIRAITGVRPKASLADARPLRLRDCDRISELMCQKCPFSGLRERLVWVEGLVVVKRTHRERTSQCRTPYSPLRKPAGSSDSPQEPWHSSGTPAVVLASSN